MLYHSNMLEIPDHLSHGGDSEYVEPRGDQYVVAPLDDLRDLIVQSGD